MLGRISKAAFCLILAGWPGSSPVSAAEPPRIAEVPDPAAVERGRIAITRDGLLKPAWSAGAYAKVAEQWKVDAPDPKVDPEGYAAAFRKRYGFPEAPYPNDGLPMGLKRGVNPDGSKEGIAIDCLTCHGGSIGGTSIVGLGNTQLDLKLFFDEVMRADGRKLPPSTFTVNSARGTNNAGMFSVVLLSLRNADLSTRKFPLPMGANIPEMDTPPWWHLARKATMYYDGRTEASSVRTNMQFLLGEKSLDEFKALEPTFRDIQAYFLSLKAPKYPFEVDAARGARGEAIYAKSCAKCHGTAGPGGEYPNRIVPLDEIKTDPDRALGISPRFVEHYNATWFAEGSPVDRTLEGYQAPPLDGIWATAPYLHNGSVPTLWALLKSSDRPARFYRPPSTSFDHYDKVRVGWKFDLPVEGASPAAEPIERAHSLYDTGRFGLKNTGHLYGDALTDDQRLDLIEYLKGF